MTATVTINDTTTDLYDAREVLDVLAPFGIGGHIDGVKSRLKLETWRLFSRTNPTGLGKVMHAPHGFTWDPELLVASATTMHTRHNYFTKAQVDAIVADLAA